MRILVVNCGSSSLKYELFSMEDESVLAGGVVERVGGDRPLLTHSAGGEKVEREVDAGDPAAALRLVLDALVDPRSGVIDRLGQIDGVGHRVVHGGEGMYDSAVVDDAVVDGAGVLAG